MPVKPSYDEYVQLVLNESLARAVKAAVIVEANAISRTGAGGAEHYEALGFTPEEAEKARLEAMLRAALAGAVGRR